ncbi:unnamed protein product [Cochlearia groenlandica]
MTIAAAPARQIDRSASPFSMTAKAVAVPVQVPPGAVVSEGLGKDALISWFRGEFAAANAIIDAMCSHIRKNEIGDGEAVSGSEYDAVFAAIHRRRLNWIPVLQMQKYHSIAEVAIELQKVAANKKEDLREKKTEAEDLTEKKTETEEKKVCFNGVKVTENEINGDVEDVEDDSPSSDITDSGSHQDVQQAAAAAADTPHIICQNHEDCDARSCEIKPIKGFQAKEQVKGHTVNVVKGLKLYEELLKQEELTKLIDFVAELREAGQNGKLSGESFILFNKQIKGNKRELIQLGVPIFGHAKDENSNDSNNSVNIEPIPPLLESVIDHFITWRLIPQYKRPNGCVINFFEEGEYSQPFLKPPHLEQPISTLVLSESTMAFGRILSSDNEGNFKGPLSLSLKQGSLLVMRGNSADMARHVMCPSQNKRVSITFFRVRPEVNHNHSHPNDGVMTMWQQQQQQPCHYPMTPNPFISGYDPSVLHPPMVLMAPPPILSSPNVMGNGGGTGVFLPWATAVSSRKHVKHLPPRAQKKRLVQLPAAAAAGESTSEPVISVGGA